MTVGEVIEYLKSKNTYIEKSLIEGFVNEINIKYLPIYFFEYFALNKNAQEKVKKLTEKQIIVLAQIIKYAEINNVDWVTLCGKYSQFIENEKYKYLVSDLETNELTDDIIEKFLFVISNYGNYYKVESFNDLYNLDNIRDDKNKNSKTNDPNIILLNKYGISYDTAFNIYNRYGKDIYNLPESKEKELLIDIKNIIEGKGTDRIVCNDYKLIVNNDALLRNMFANIYNKELYKCEDSKLIDNVDGIPVYDAGVDFTLCIYSYGLASDLTVPENFKDDWNRKTISVDYMCNSIINSLNMKTHIKHCVYGFNNIGTNELALLGSNDLGTGGIYQDVNITNPYYQDKLIADVEFRTPNELINNTRFTNNEVYRNRRRNVDGKLEHINPDYIVFFKTGEDNEEQVKIETLKAAKDFNVPIVLVDCEKCLLHNLEILEKKLTTFESRYDDSISIKKIIETIYSLTNGFRDVAPNLISKYLSYNQLMNYVNRISNHIDKISSVSPKTALECTNIFIDTLEGEFDKVLKSPYWVNKSREEGYTVEKPKEIIDYLKNKKTDLEKVNYSNKKDYII